MCGFLQHLTCRGGPLYPPSRSAPNSPRASRKKRACCLQWEEADGIQFYDPRSTGDLRGQVKHPNLVNWDGDLADAIKLYCIVLYYHHGRSTRGVAITVHPLKPTKASKSLSKWLRTVQITLILTLGEKVIKGHPRSVTSDDLGWPRMTLTHSGSNIVYS